MEICRTCLGNTNLYPLKGDEGLLYKIEIISSIHISIDIPDYPTKICEECIEKVNQFYCFRKVIINSDNELKEKYELSSQISDQNQSGTKRKRVPIKSTKTSRKRKKIQSQVVSTSTLDEVKTEPEEENSYEDYIVDCDLDIVHNDIKDESEEVLSSSKPVLNCEDCGITFNSKVEFNTHNRTKHKVKYRKKSKSLGCESCNVTFNSKTELANHKRNVHTAPGICNICGVVVRADNLKKHVQRHSEDPVKCKVCEKVLKNSESLRGHMLIHRGTTYECEQCEKTFTLKSEYHRHLKKHADPNVRKKMCTVCGKHVRDLQRHLFTHTGERPYICTFCKKGLTSSYALKLHIRQHTNEKPFICEYCSKGFAQKISLIAHLKSKAHS